MEFDRRHAEGGVVSYGEDGALVLGASHGFETGQTPLVVDNIRFKVVGRCELIDGGSEERGVAAVGEGDSPATVEALLGLRAFRFGAIDAGMCSPQHALESTDKLDEKLAEEYGIEMIAPNRRKRSKTQDGRPLRRYKRRWRVERLFAWLHTFRRLVTRWEYQVETFLASKWEAPRGRGVRVTRSRSGCLL